MLSLSRRASAFIDRWDRITLNERAVAQSHFNELCQLLDIQPPTHTEQYRFEKPLTKVGGQAGFADVWRRDCFAWEYKTKDRYPTLRAAYEQLQLYKEDLDNPPVLAASDVGKYEVHVVYTGYKTRIEHFTNADLANLNTRDFLALALSDPIQLRPAERAETVTAQAAAKVAHIAQMLEKRGLPPDQVASFFTKIVFAFFAEDIQLIPHHVLSESLRQAVFAPNDFPQILQTLFRTMQTGGYFGPLARIPHVNGGLFADATVLPLTVDEIQFLAEAAKLDWAQVDPTIFGTLFERSLDPALRSQLGLHYTSRADIELIVEPVLMRPLYREWEQVQAHVSTLRAPWEQAIGAAKQKYRAQIEGHLYDFADRLTQIKVLDPACGSGNFLYVALYHLKNLEKQVVVYANGIGVEAPAFGISPSQLYGIEKNPIAASLAQIAVWVGYIQWMYNNGIRDQITEPILSPLKTIECRDAILAFDGQGKAYEPKWPDADVIIGNPPFLGSIKHRGELGETYLSNLAAVYHTKIPPKSDFVCYWFEKARQAVEDNTRKRCGLIATQAIRKGLSRTVLDRIKKTGDIFLAYSNRPWILDGASVRVSIICFDTGLEECKMLDEIPVSSINPDLSTSADITTAKTLLENKGVAFPGTKKYGAFDIEPSLARRMLDDQSNSNGNPNSDVVKPWVNGSDLVGTRRGMWIIDFGVKTSMEAAAKYQVPFEYVRNFVKPDRDKERIASTRDNWWLFERQRPEMRQATNKVTRFIATPVVSKYRIFVWLTHPTIPDAKVTVFAKDDDYSFGVLHSSIHRGWSSNKGARHGAGNDLTYNTTECFETFPFPWAPGTEDQADPRVIAIASAAKRLVELRDAWLNPPDLSEAELKKRTLTNLYNARPDWLAEAHTVLDHAVADAYGWPHDLRDEQILERLLALNLERAAQGGAAKRSAEATEDAGDDG